MNDERAIKQLPVTYIETPRRERRPEKISSVLETRMRLLTRKRRRYLRRESKQ